MRSPSLGDPARDEPLSRTTSRMRMRLRKGASGHGSGSQLGNQLRAEMLQTQKVDILASYSPRMLIQRFGEDPTPPAAASEEAFFGAVVFVDVSGFTALSEALSKEHGPIEGAELLNLYINAYDARGSHRARRAACSAPQPR